MRGDEGGGKEKEGTNKKKKPTQEKKLSHNDNYVLGTKKYGHETQSQMKFVCSQDVTLGLKAREKSLAMFYLAVEMKSLHSSNLSSPQQ